MKIFEFFNILWHTFFDANIFKHHIVWNIYIYFLHLMFLGFDLIVLIIILNKNIVNFFHNNDIVKVQTWYPWKIVECDNILDSFHSVLSP